MLAGARAKAARQPGLPSGETQIFSIVNLYYAEYGRVPARLTAQEIRAIPSFKEYSDEQLDVYRNPITDEWPTLNATSFSQGDVYIRPLTVEELNYFAERLPYYGKLWLDGKGTNPQTGMQDQSVKLQSPVFYLRMCGHNGVLTEGVKYIYKPI